MSRRHLPFALAGILAVFGALPAAATAAGSQSHSGRLTAVPAVLPASGGDIHLQARVPGATLYRFVSAERGVLFTRRHVHGRASAVIVLPANLAPTSRTYHFMVRAKVAGRVLTRRAVVVEAAATPVPAITIQPLSQGALYGTAVVFTAAASNYVSVIWQLSTDAGVSWTNLTSPDATSTSYTANPANATASGAQSGYEYRAVFSNAGGQTASAAANLRLMPVASSSNWSGYVAVNEIFSAVSGSWTVPAVTCPAGISSMGSQWVGVDGWGGSTVEQDGVEMNCVNGAPQYYAWYEMYGDPAVGGGYEMPLSNPVAPGDAFSASVSLTGSVWLMTLTDSTQSWSVQVPVAAPVPAPAQSSAEWVVEENTSSDQSAQQLSDFGSAGFTSAHATDSLTSGPISSFPFTAIVMTNPTTLAARATPGALDPTGTSFSDAWNAAS